MAASRTYRSSVRLEMQRNFAASCIVMTSGDDNGSSLGEPGWPLTGLSPMPSLFMVLLLGNSTRRSRNGGKGRRMNPRCNGLTEMAAYCVTCLSLNSVPILAPSSCLILNFQFTARYNGFLGSVVYGVRFGPI